MNRGLLSVSGSRILSKNFPRISLLLVMRCILRFDCVREIEAESMAGRRLRLIIRSFVSTTHRGRKLFTSRYIVPVVLVEACIPGLSKEGMLVIRVDTRCVVGNADTSCSVAVLGTIQGVGLRDASTVTAVDEQW